MDRSTLAVDEVGRILRADGADLAPRRGESRRPRASTCARARHRRLRGVRAPARHAARDDQRVVAAPDRRRVRARARRSAPPYAVAELGRSDRRAARRVEHARRPCTSRCCTTSCARSKTTPASTPACSRRSRTSHAPSRAGRMRLSELHELMHPRYSQPGLSRLVQRMEADGLVERRADPDDGRATVLVMTRAGRARFATGRRGVHGRAAGALRAASHRRREARALEARPRRRSLRARATSGAAVAYRSASDDQVHRIEAPPRAGARRSRVAVGARSALDLFTGTTRVAQELKRAGHARDRGRLRALRRGVRARATSRLDARDGRRRGARRRAAPTSRHAPGATATSPRRSACSRASSSRTTGAGSTRSATRSSATTASRRCIPCCSRA